MSTVIVSVAMLTLYSPSDFVCRTNGAPPSSGARLFLLRLVFYLVVLGADFESNANYFTAIRMPA